MYRISHFSFRIIAVMLLCLIISTSFGQTVVQIGFGNSSPANTLYSPVYRFSASSTTLDCRSNIIYTASELSAAGINNGDIITALGFNKLTADNFVTPATYTIMMGNTNNPAPLTGTIATQWANILTTHSVVYTSNAFNMPNVAGWMTINLQTPFVYTGGSIEIATDLIMGGNGATTGPFKFEYTTGFAGNIIGATSGNSNLASYKQRPNIRFTVQPGTPCVNPPNAGLAISSISSGCINETLQLDLNGNSIGNGMTYIWQESIDNVNFTDIGTASVTSVYNTTITGTKWYRCKLSCNNQTPVYSASVLINLISPEIIVNNNIVSMCGNGTTVLSANAVDPSVSIEWYADSLLTNLLFTGSNFTTPYIAGNTTFYVVGVGGANNCRSAVQKIYVRVDGAPEVDLGSDFEVCVTPDDMYFLNAKNSGSDYLWDNGYNGQIRVIDQSGTYWVTVSNTNGCSSSDTIEVKLKPMPKVDLGNDTTICINAKIILDAGADGMYYQWSTGATSRTITSSNANEYFVAVTAENGCVAHDSIKIRFQGEMPKHDGIWVRNLGADKFKFALHNPANVISYAWDFGDGSRISYEDSPTHIFPNDGNYVVRLITNSVCGSKMDTTVVHIKGLNMQQLDGNNIRIYPNPAQDYISVVTENQKVNHIAVYAVSGQLMLHKELKYVSEFNLDISSLVNGVYYLKLRSEDGVEYQAKFVKE